MPLHMTRCDADVAHTHRTLGCEIGKRLTTYFVMQVAAMLPKSAKKHILIMTAVVI